MLAIAEVGLRDGVQSRDGVQVALPFEVKRTATAYRQMRAAHAVVFDSQMLVAEFKW